MFVDTLVTDRFFPYPLMRLSARLDVSTREGTTAKESSVELQSYLRALRKRWRIIVGCTLIALSLAALLTLLTPKTYSSSIRFFVSTADASNNSQLAQGGTFTQDRVKSYTELMTTPRVLQPVAEELKIKDGASSIEPKVVAKAAPDTVIIDTTVTDTNPNRAKAIATSLGTQFPKSVDELERVSDSKPSPVKVTLVQTPTKSEKVGPNWLTNLILAGLLGLLAGTALALLRDRLDTKIRNKDDVEAAAEDITVLGAIPFDSDAPKHPLILEADPHSSRAEAFRSLRTNLQFVDAANTPRSSQSPLPSQVRARPRRPPTSHSPWQTPARASASSKATCAVRAFSATSVSKAVSASPTSSSAEWPSRTWPSASVNTASW